MTTPDAPPTNLHALLTDHPFAEPGTEQAPLVHTVDEAYTAAEVMRLVDELAECLDGLTGQPVAAVADGFDALVAMFAVWKVGAVYVPVNPRQPAAAINDTVARTDAAAVVRDRRVSRRSSGTRHPAGAGFILWTSGTTGEPRPILHAHAAYLELIDRVLAPLRAAPRRSARPDQQRRSARPVSPNLIPVSMALNAGIYNALFGLRAGAPLVLMDRFTTTDFARLVTRHHIRSTVLPPAAIAMLNDDEGISDLGPLRYVRSITAPLSPFQARRFTARFGAFVLNGYGQAEIGEVIGWTAADAREHPDRIGAAGRPHDGVAIRIADPDENGVGELLVRPPNTALDLEPGRVDADGYVRTGDLARVDDAAFVWIEGRRSDLINRGGNKVFPDEVEEVLNAVPGVGEVAVVARADDRLGEVPIAVVVGHATEADLDAAARAHLAAYKVPVAWVRRNEPLPRSAAGKLLRRALTEVPT